VIVTPQGNIVITPQFDAHHRKRVRLIFEAPPAIRIYRAEILDAKSLGDEVQLNRRPQ